MFCILNIVITLACVAALRCSDIDRVEPRQVQSYQGRANKKAFLRHERNQLHLNANIPPVCEESLRVATFNIHFLRDATDTYSNARSVIKTLAAINPHVAVLQEIPARMGAFPRLLRSIGYIYQFSRLNDDEPLGNMIISKLPLYSTKSLRLDGKRNAVAATLTMRGKRFTIVGTHLEVQSEDIRVAEAGKLSRFINQLEGSRLLLAGDFNSLPYSRPLQKILGKTGLREAHEQCLEWSLPKYTCWASRSIDFILLSDTLCRSSLGAYTYHTAASDHLPVVVDLAI